MSASNNRGCLVNTHSIIISVNINTAINDIKNTSQLIQIADILGRKEFLRKSIPFLYHYNDGTIDKRIVIE